MHFFSRVLHAIIIWPAGHQLRPHHVCLLFGISLYLFPLPPWHAPQVIIFGPIIGIATAVLVYATATPQSISEASKLRAGSSWVRRCAVLCLLCCAMSCCAVA